MFSDTTNTVERLKTTTQTHGFSDEFSFKETLIYQLFTESQNHRMLGVGRALWGSPSPTPCPSRVTHSRLHSTAARWGLNISREGNSTKVPPSPSNLGGQQEAGSQKQGPKDWGKEDFFSVPNPGLQTLLKHAVCTGDQQVKERKANKNDSPKSCGNPAWKHPLILISNRQRIQHTM